MQITQLIKLLEDIKTKHGDIKVLLPEIVAGDETGDGMYGVTDSQVYQFTNDADGTQEKVLLLHKSAENAFTATT